MFFDRHPFASAAHLRHDMNDLFNNVLGNWPQEGRASHRGFPALNVWEDSECLHVEAEVPGLSLNDVEIFVIGNELTVKGRRPALKGNELNYHRQERGTGEFSRTVTLPYEVNSEKVDATLKDGVLTLTLPKAEAARPKKITVKTN
jgi:HSP20 family protein